MEAISIHAPHAGRDHKLIATLFLDNISIHAPHAGRDLGVRRHFFMTIQISIHAPHAGRDDD